MGRWLWGMAVAVLLGATAMPIVAQEPWVLWSSTDCNEWTGGCDGEYILIPEADYTQTALNVSCVDAVVVIGLPYVGLQGISVSLPVNPMVWHESTTQGVRLEIPLIHLVHGSFIRLRATDEQESYVTGVLIYCYDPLPAEPSEPGESTIPTVTYGEGGIIVALLFLAGIVLLQVMVRLGERITDR